MNQKTLMPLPLENSEVLHLPKSEQTQNVKPAEKTEREAVGRRKWPEIKVGEKHSRLLILGFTEIKGERRAAYRCDCGNIGVSDPRSVTRGLAKSCGCLLYEQLKKQHDLARVLDRGRARRDWSTYVGQRVSGGLVIGYTPSEKGKPDTIAVRCDCGAISETSVYDIKKKRCRACAYARQKQETEKRFPRWWKRLHDGIISRCFCETNDRWHSYGGRGIDMFEDWRKNPMAMLEYLGPRPSKNHSVDRIDNDGGYYPGNVRWATRKEQQNNRRNNILLEFNGKTQSLSKWAEEYGLKRATLERRISSGWSILAALTTPLCR
jgi:hypothetical protein